jgi:conjugal transfer/type IV secretion protein DotA/TraY
MRQHTKVKWLGAAVAALVLLAPLYALAQANVVTPSPESYQPTSSDLTGYIIRSIFGDWNSGNVAPVLGAAMRALNLFALSFGTLMFTYVAVVGTLNTAQDGEILGKKWNTMMVPIRFVMGTVMLVPLASGYSTVQHVILWLALAGGGGASAIWAAALDGFTSPDKAAAVVQNGEDYKNKVRTLMRNILKAEVCTAILNDQYSGVAKFGMTRTDPMNSPLEGALMPAAVYLHGYTYRWGDTSGTGGKSADTCGSLDTTSFADGNAPPDMSFGGVYGDAQQTGLQSGSQGAPSDGSYQAMINGQANGVQAAVPILQTFAATMVATSAPNDPAASTAAVTPQARAALTEAATSAALTQATTNYINAASPAFSLVTDSANNKLSKFINSSSQLGWMMASSSFFQMARIRSAANAAMSSLPEFHARTDTKTVASGSYPGVAEGPMFEDVKAAENRIAEMLPGEDSWWKSGNPGQWMARKLGTAFSFDATSPKHSLVQIKDTGDVILDATVTAFVAGAAFYVEQSMVGNTVLGKVVDAGSGAFAGIRAFFEIMGPAIMMGFFALFGVGLTMAFLLPMLPFMLSIGSILGWLMAVFSAMVAAPIWLAGHLHPEGDGIAGKAVGGYMILLETVTRPVFIVFGLIGAFVIMDPMLRFVAWAFQANMQSVQGNSLTGVISIGIFAMIYVAIVWTVTRQSLQLIHSLSEKVYLWIGGQNAGYDQARDFGAAAQQSTGRAASGVAQGAQSALAAGAARANSRKPVLGAEAQNTQKLAGLGDTSGGEEG